MSFKLGKFCLINYSTEKAAEVIETNVQTIRRFVVQIRCHASSSQTDPLIHWDLILGPFNIPNGFGIKFA
jgi:hypothetical protein